MFDSLWRGGGRLTPVALTAVASRRRMRTRDELFSVGRVTPEWLLGRGADR
jgi:hypothetical protein